MKKIRRAIISVTDKTGLVKFAGELAAMGVEIISTGGTASMLEQAGINIVPVSDYTGFPEMMDGRLKTLHPLIHGGLLGIRNNKGHADAMKEHRILPIDMVVVNLYQFENKVSSGCSFDEVIENIDIGGPAMLRSAAKNYRDVMVVTDPSDYDMISEEMRSNNAFTCSQSRFAMALKAFQLTAGYDAAISNYLGTITDGDGVCRFPDRLTRQFMKVQDLRYGENPHQSAAFYKDSSITVPGVHDMRQLHGKELSFNNILDVNAALGLIMELEFPSAVILKHSNPCGVSFSREGISEAYRKALSCDPLSAFGGVVALNRPLDEVTAKEMSGLFLEVVIAPSFDDRAFRILAEKKNIRLLEIPEDYLLSRGKESPRDIEMRGIAGGGILVQTRDSPADIEVRNVTRRVPSEDELKQLLFVWSVCKHVKSNAIVLAKGNQTVGIGAGQMSRIDSVRIAIMKAGDARLSLKGSVMASDAFFPFSDSIDAAYKAGVKAVIQPGGSIRDDEVIEVANKHDMSMIFTGKRHFKH